MVQVCEKCGLEHLDERTFCRRCGSRMDGDVLSATDVTLSSLARDDMTWVNMVGETSTISRPDRSSTQEDPSRASARPSPDAEPSESVAHDDGRLAYVGQRRQRSPRADAVTPPPRVHTSRAGTYMLVMTLFVFVLAVTAVYLASSSN